MHTSSLTERRGLKCEGELLGLTWDNVVSHRETWIEIFGGYRLLIPGRRLSQRDVD